MFLKFVRFHLNNHFLPLLFYVGIYCIVEMVVEEQKSVTQLLPFRVFDYVSMPTLVLVRKYLVFGLFASACMLFCEKLLVLIGTIKRGKGSSNPLIRSFVENHFVSFCLLSSFLFLIECQPVFEYVSANVYPLPPFIRNYQYHVTIILMVESLLLTFIKVGMLLSADAVKEKAKVKKN